MIFVYFLVIITLFRLLISRYFPLIGDEAYYWLWSRRLDLSYVDHPPLIAYYLKGLTLILGNNEFTFRLGAIILVTLTTILVYRIGKELFDTRTGTISAIIFNLIPIFLGGSLFLVPQQPFLFFWTLSTYFFIKVLKSGKGYWWYFLGTSVGLGLLSDYIMFLFFPTVGLYLVLNKHTQYWWSRKEPYLGALIAFVLFSPVIIWNLTQGFTPLDYLAARSRTALNPIQNLLTFISLETILYTPVFFLIVFYLILKMWKPPSEKVLLLGCLSAPVMLVFLLISPFIMVGGHWPAAAYIPAILFISQLRNKKYFWSMGIALFFAVLVNILAFTYYLYLYPTPKELVGQEFTINQKLPEFLSSSKPAKGKTYFYANNLGVAGLISFHGKVDTYMAPGRLKQFDIWGRPKLDKGDNIIYFVLNESELYEKLIPLFKKVKIEPHQRLFTKDADIPNKTKIYHCIGYKGGTLP